MGHRKDSGDSVGKTREKPKKSGGERTSAQPESSRRKKVVSLRNRVNEGTYRVDPDAVAEKMVDDAVRKIRSRIRPQ